MMCLVVLCVLSCVQGVFEVCVERGLVLAEIGEGVSLEEVRAATGASFQVYIYSLDEGPREYFSNILSAGVC